MTPQQKQLSTKFLVYRFFLNLWFVEAIWLYFYRLYMNDAQIGLLDAAAFGIGLLAEIPSGALADKFGHARIAKLGIVIAALGLSLQAVGGFWPILLFQVLVMIGFSFISGADEALFFEKLRLDKHSVEWRRLVTKAGQAAYAAAVIGIPLGGFLYQMNHELVFVLNGFTILVSGILIWGIRDEKLKRTKQKVTREFKEYMGTIKEGFRAFSHKNLRIYVPLIMTVQGVLYIFNWGLLKIILMDRFHFSEQFGGVVLGVGCLLVVLILYLMQRYAERFHEKRILTVLSMLVAGSLLVSVPDIGLFGIAVIFILYAGDGVFYPFLSDVLNKHAPNNQRATILSVASFLKVLPYVILAPLIGLLNMQGKLHWFLIGWTALIMMAWAYYIVSKRRDEVILVQESYQ